MVRKAIQLQTLLSMIVHSQPIHIEYGGQEFVFKAGNYKNEIPVEWRKYFVEDIGQKSVFFTDDSGAFWSKVLLDLRIFCPIRNEDE